MYITLQLSKASVSELGDGSAIGLAVVATLMACAAGGVTVLVMWKFITGRYLQDIYQGGDWSLCKMINGCLAGNNFLLVYRFNYILTTYDIDVIVGYVFSYFRNGCLLCRM